MADARVEIIRRLTRREAWPSLKRTLEKTRAEDIAAAVNLLAPTHQRRLVDCIDDDSKMAEIFCMLNARECAALTTSIPFERLVTLMQLMPIDDEADVIASLPDDLRRKVLNALEGDEKAQLEDILAWPVDSAGGIMHPAAFRLKQDLTCRDAISALQEAGDLEMVFYLYVENEQNQLVGVASLRGLLTHPPSTPLKAMMSAEVISVPPETDQEEVARIVDRYDLLALPIVDPDRRLLGIVTIDDIVDVIKEEAVEDMMLMAGLGENLNPAQHSVFNSFRERFQWLLLTLVGGIGMAELINVFEGDLAKQTVLAGFIPVMLGTGGNVGTQAATIAVRNIATGHAGSIGTPQMLFREARVGALLGVGFAVILGGYALARWFDQPMLGLSIAISLIVIVINAAALGMLVPLTLNRIGVDPAVATGPFVTTGIDLVAILIYFGTCGVLLN